jgi:hypothetical protein
MVVILPLSLKKGGGWKDYILTATIRRIRWAYRLKQVDYSI